jgi:hypothetical protein
MKTIIADENYFPVYEIDPTNGGVSVNDILDKLNVDHAEQEIVTIGLKAVLDVATKPFYVHRSISTENCEQALSIRYNPAKNQFGVDPENEVKTLLRQSRRSSVMDVFILLSNMSVPPHLYRNANNVNIYAHTELKSGEVTPVSLLFRMKQQSPELISKIRCHFSDESRQAMLKVPFVTNNVGSRTVSCVVDSTDYVKMINSAVTGLHSD